MKVKTAAITRAICLVPLFGIGQLSIGQSSPTTSTSSISSEEFVSGKFELLNHHGNQVDQGSYDGQYRLVFFGFTECPDICPTTMSRIGQLMRQLDKNQANEIKPIFISVDTENDSIEKLAQYVSYFHPSIDGLTGSKQQLEQAAEGFNSTFGKNTAGDQSSGTYYHSSYIYLMDKEGLLLDVFGHATSVDILLEEVQKLL